MDLQRRLPERTEMYRLTAETSSSSSAFVSWEEVNVSSDKGRREVHYYLKRRNGTSDLVVIGKEKSARHMSYHYAIRDRYLLSISPSSSLLKLRSRREVVDWLGTIVSDAFRQSSQASSLGSIDTCKLDTESLKDNQLRRLGHCATEFVWLDTPWTCRKKRRHYPSFLRNGVKISVNDFVFVLAEENKQLVAFLDDMYEDARGNKMVVVRWFHKIDEVGIILPHNYNDREIFFSLCLQDLSIECIDGLATVLAPEHYEKYITQCKHTRLEPFMCQSLFDNDETKPFDITQIKGYWKQETLKYITGSAILKRHVNSSPSEVGVGMEGNLSDGVVARPRKRLRRSKEDDPYLNRISINTKVETDVGRQKNYLAAGVPERQDAVQKPMQHLTVGSQVEVLTQDSGLRGCWFRAVIIKKHKDKVKVQYQDIKDADDEANSLQEWLLVSKVSGPDRLGLRMPGRTAIRPTPTSNKDKVQLYLCAGTVVDAWWHDGWWEAIVLEKENEDRIRVYFPGESQDSTFACGDLRLSKEWAGNRWENIKERPDLVTSILSDLQEKPVIIDKGDGKVDKPTIDDGRELVTNAHEECLLVKDEVMCGKPRIGAVANKLKEMAIVWDLSKDAKLAELKWKSSKRRTRCIGDKNKSSPESVGARVFDRFFVRNSLQVDHDNCKYIGDSHFGSSVVPALTSLVMSR